MVGEMHEHLARVRVGVRVGVRGHLVARGAELVDVARHLVRVRVRVRVRVSARVRIRVGLELG